MNRDTYLYSEKLRFDWRDLPAVTADFPGTGGEVRVNLEDFIVTEVPSYLPSGSGAHAYAFIEKRGLTTFDVVTALKALGVPRRDIGFAGQKDKHAVTRQWLSVPEQFAGQLQALDGMEGVEVLEVSRHQNKLRIGHLRANRFEVRVRNPLFAWPLRAQEIIAHLETVGLPNYFGPQRFGRFNSNAVDAMRMLRGEDVCVPQRVC
jgi:tRNA pseudouridine13 synthase